MSLSDLILPIGVCGGALVIVLAGIGVFWFVRKRKNGGVDVVKIKKQLEVEEPEIEEETEDEVEEVKPQPKPQVQLPMCVVVITGGKAYRGLYLGEDAQWLKIRTEKVPLLAFSKAHVILVTFEALPTPVQAPPAKKAASEDLSIDSLEV